MAGGSDRRGHDMGDPPDAAQQRTSRHHDEARAQPDYIERPVPHL